MGFLVTGFAFAEDGPVIAKDTIQLTAFTINSYRKNYDIWSWVPQVQFRPIGRTPSGGQMYVEYTIPGGPAIKTDCKTGVVTEGRTRWRPRNPGR